MKKWKFLICLFALTTLHIVPVMAQDTAVTRIINWDPDANKIVPDKVYEIGLPLVFLFVLLNAVVSIFKIKAEQQLKREAINKGFSEQAIVEMFRTDQLLNRYAFLKWFLLLFSFGISLIIIHILAYTAFIRSGYLALGIIMVFLSAAFFIYFRIIKDK